MREDKRYIAFEYLMVRYYVEEGTRHELEKAARK